MGTLRLAIRYGIIFAALLYIIVNIPLCAISNAPRLGETWDSVNILGRAEKVVVWAVVQSVLAVGLDLFISILPISLIIKLRLSTPKRIRLLAFFTIALM